MQNIAIIIVNWNGQRFLKDCLDSINKQNYRNFDIFLVDNNSTDGSLEIARNYKNIKVIRNKQNLGFARGNNVGIKRALKEGYKFIVLVNYDTVADESWLENLVKRAEHNPEIGAVQSKILLSSSNCINTTGGELHFLGFSYCGNYKSKDIYHDVGDIPLFSGASVLISAEALKKAGLFDESFFMYMEDADLSWRIRQLGYKIMFEPKSVIYHKYSFSKNKNKFYYAERNRLIFVLKNYELKTLFLLLPAFIVTEFLMLAYALFGGWIKVKLKGYFYLIKDIRIVIGSRKAVQKIRKVRDRELKKYFTYKLSFEEIENPLFRPLNLFFKIYWFLVRPFI